MEILAGEKYVVNKPSWDSTGVCTVKVLKVGIFRVFCRWNVHDCDYDCYYETTDWIPKRKFICRQEDW